MGFEFYRDNAFLIPLLPLVGAVISGFLGVKWLRGRSHWPIWITVGISTLLSIGLLIATINDAHHGPRHVVGESVHWFTWIETGNFRAAAGAWLDPLSAVMLSVVCVVGLLICIFAAGYMKGEDGYFRFFAYLGLFIFAMTCLVMGNNLVILYVGWEGVGLCSFLLIGYYYDKPAAREAAKKAFLVNRVGDLGFAIGIMLCYWAFGTVTYFGYTHHEVQYAGLLDLVHQGVINKTLTPSQSLALAWIPFCLLLGAIGKSAQFPLYVWLPDAMEGPTPVSALIHAATMVTAGVYMIARCGVLFASNPAALTTVAVVGTFTALLAAVIALRQFDLKKVFAYSTVSQLGFMFAGVGVLAPVAGVFHLVTHAFFKSLLFLSSGVVMHAMLGELDMRKMSGLKRVLPKTRILMLVGCAALAGFPFLAGFFSKDEIIGAVWDHSRPLGLVLMFTAFLTAYYTFRLYFRVFEGPEVIPPEPLDRSPGIHYDDPAHGHTTASASAVQAGDTAESGVDEHLQTAAHQAATAAHDDHAGGHHHNHEPAIMIAPLFILMAGAILAGYLNWPKPGLGDFLGHSRSFTHAYDVARETLPNVNPEPLGQPGAEGHETTVPEGHTGHALLMAVSGLISLAGIGLAYQLHLKDRRAGEALPRRFPAFNRAVENKFWVDELYQNAIVEPLRHLGRVYYWIDRIIVDGLVWAIGFVPQFSGFALKLTTQRGYLQGYAGAMAFGIVVILLIVLW